MRISALPAALCVAAFAGASLAQDDGPATSFPLAAKAGVDSHADTIAPSGAVNQGAFNMNSWKFGHALDAPANTPIWNPVKLKMIQGGKVTGGTVFSSTDPETYCAMANAGYDFIWTEMQHNSRDWESVARMWNACPHAKAVPGVRVAYTDEREIQHALDAGALVLVVPTVDTVEEAIEARNWAYFPPLGRRSNGGGQAFDSGVWGGVPGGYRNTINDNLVLVLMIETLEGLKNADEIAKVPGIHVLFIGPRDLSHDLGVPGDTSAPAFQDALKRVLAAAEDAGLAAGILAPDAETARRYADRGLRFIGIGSDATLLALAGKHAVDRVRRTRASG